MNSWYKLDVAANLFPSVTTSNNSSVFRISAVLCDTIDEDLLQKSADEIIERFPLLFARMRKGFFWNYFDTNSVKFSVQRETDYPCANINPLENNGYLIKVLYYNNRVSVEVFHALTDGSGAVEFLKSLLYYYFSYKYGVLNSEGMVLLADDNVKENIKDSFKDYFVEKNSRIKKKEKSQYRNAYRIRGNRYPNYGHNIITGVLSAHELNNRAKQDGATITAYLCAVLIQSIYQGQQRYYNDKNPIVIAVPVNLRKSFLSKTLRNFFAVVNLSYKVNAETTFQEILESVTKQLKRFTEQNNLSQIATANVSLSRNMFSKVVPLVIKNYFVSLGFNLWGESKKTITLSNIGNIKIPTEMERYIEHFEAVLYPTKKSPINCGVISVNDKLTMNFSRAIDDIDVAKCFFEFLSKEDSIPVTVYSNKWGDSGE